MFIKFFVSVSVIFSIQTDAIFFELFSRFFWVISFKAKRCPLRPTKTGVAIDVGREDPVISVAGPFEGTDQEIGLGEAKEGSNGEAVFFIDLGLGL